MEFLVISAQGESFSLIREISSQRVDLAGCVLKTEAELPVNWSGNNRSVAGACPERAGASPAPEQNRRTLSRRHATGTLRRGRLGAHNDTLAR